MSGYRVATVVWVGLLAGCSGKAPVETKQLVVGAMTPLTGVTANTYWNKSIEMAVRDVNAALAASDKGKNIQFKLEVRDQGSVAATGVPALVRELAGSGAKMIQTADSTTTQTANALNYDTSGPLGTVVLGAVATGALFENKTLVATTDGRIAPTNPDGGLGAASAAPSNGLPLEANVGGFKDPDGWLWRPIATGIGTGTAAARVGTEVWKDWLSRGPGADGDVDGSGTVKFVNYRTTFTTQCNAADFSQLVDKSKLRCELVPGPPDTAEPSYNFGADAQKVFDTNNTSVTGAQMYTNAIYQAAVGTMYFDATGKTTGPLPSDGVPDFVMIGLLPGNTPGLISEYRKTFAAQQPKTVIVGGDGFLRGANFQFLGTATEGVEVGATRVLAANDESGTYFAGAFETFAGLQPMGFDANVYDSTVVGLLGVLKAALPLEDPRTVTNVQVRDALAHLSVPGSGVEVVRPGPEGFKRAIELFAAGTADINYEGAGGPVDFDVNGSVALSDFGYYKVESGRLKLKKVFQCVKFPATCDPLTLP